MEANHAIKFYLIAKYFKNDEKQLKRGENAYTSGHVRKMIFDLEAQPAVIKGEVQASMKKTTYKVEVYIHLKEGVVSSHCTCPRGQAICHHIAALLYHAHYNISSTDKARAWGVQSVAPEADLVQTIDRLYPRESYTALVGDITDSKIEEFRNRLGQTNVVGFSWLLKPEADSVTSALVPSIDEILFAEEYYNASDKEKYLLERCAVEQDRILEIAKRTIGQHSNESWMITRKMRLTASKFGSVLAACRRNKYPPSLFKSLLEGYDLHRALAVQWGKDNEETALKLYSELSGRTVEPTGLWLDKCGFLGASPDGLIGEDTILEIKCPYKFRNCSIQDGVADRKYFFHYEGEEAMIDREHMYYHQIQGQLYITGRELCIFFVWTPNEFEVLEIEKDPEWISNLDVLKNFYLKKFIPAIFTLK